MALTTRKVREGQELYMLEFRSLNVFLPQDGYKHVKMLLHKPLSVALLVLIKKNGSPWKLFFGFEYLKGWCQTAVRIRSGGFRVNQTMILFSETCFKCKFGVCSQSVRQLYKTTTSCTSWGSIFLSIGFCNVLRYVIKRYTHIKSGALITWIGKVSLKIFLKADIFGVDALDKSFMPNAVFLWLSRGRFKHFCLTVDWASLFHFLAWKLWGLS